MRPPLTCYRTTTRLHQPPLPGTPPTSSNTTPPPPTRGRCPRGAASCLSLQSLFCLVGIFRPSRACSYLRPRSNTYETRHAIWHHDIRRGAARLVWSDVCFCKCSPWPEGVAIVDGAHHTYVG